MSKRSAKNKRIVIVLIVIALVAVGGALYIKAHQKSATATYNPQTKVAGKGGGSAGQSGGVVNNNASAAGQSSGASTATPSTTSTSSASGIITLTSPATNATIGNGTVVAGTASGLSVVQYRIKDTVRGVIASGQLTVANGSFSGTIQGLNPGSSTGTLEVYDYKNGNGAEENGAEVNVKFQ